MELLSAGSGFFASVKTRIAFSGEKTLSGSGVLRPCRDAALGMTDQYSAEAMRRQLL